MASDNKPQSKSKAPDAAKSYERADPKNESGAGAMDNRIAKATPTDAPDALEKTVTNRQDTRRQVNGVDIVNRRGGDVSED